KMTESNEPDVPLAGLRPPRNPWEIFEWSNSQLSSMYTDWGIYFQRRHYIPASMRYLNKALDLNENDTDALRRRARVKRMQARAPDALIDCTNAKAILKSQNPNVFDYKINLEVSDSLYESNQLENSLRTLHLNKKLFSDSKAQAVQNRMTVITENLQDALSDETAPAVHRLINMMNTGVSGSKSRTRTQDCDVLSILETEQEFVSPLEKSRRKRQFKIYNQRYLDNFWKDVSFFKEIRENQNLLIGQFSESSASLKSLTEDSYKIARTFTKMLHTRSPMYCVNTAKNELNLKYQQDNLFRIQYQTRRNMFKILRTIRNLIRTNKMIKLTNYVDDVMGNYVTIKTNRIMPWKFEFVNEVYNYLGLARLNEFKIPDDMKLLSGKQRLMTLFKIPTELDFNRKKKFDSIRRQAAVDPKAEKFNKLSARYEHRMRFAKFSIERSYLYHEYAQAHLDINSFDACCLLARKSIDEAIKGKNYSWAVLSALVACKAHTILGKVEKQQEMLNEAFRLAKKLMSIDLCLFIDICLKVNTEDIDLKKHMTTPEGSIKRRSRRSNSSFEVTPSETSLE
ncbi:hypothetical protein KR044_009439, partial [Drosophila immigrans]